MVLLVQVMGTSIELLRFSDLSAAVQYSSASALCLDTTASHKPEHKSPLTGGHSPATASKMPADRASLYCLMQEVTSSTLVQLSLNP